MTIEKNIFGNNVGAEIPNQGFSRGETLSSPVDREKDEKVRSQILLPLYKFIIRLGKTMDIRNSRKTSG
jgi:hypothetical protein